MNLRNKKSPRVRQDGNTLVAAFYNANPPLIWKFDLERNHSFALALQGEDGDWELGVLSPKEEFHPVARFLSREDAEEAFSKTQNALLSRPGNIWRLVALLLAAILILLVSGLTLLHNYVHYVGTKTAAAEDPRFASVPLPPALSSLETAPAASSARMIMPDSPSVAPVVPLALPPQAIQPGVPQSADDVLKTPSQ